MLFKSVHKKKIYYYRYYYYYHMDDFVNSSLIFLYIKKVFWFVYLDFFFVALVHHFGILMQYIYHDFVEYCNYR